MDHSWASGFRCKNFQRDRLDKIFCLTTYSFTPSDSANVTTVESALTPILSRTFYRFQRMHWHTTLWGQTLLYKSICFDLQPQDLLALWPWAAQNILIGFLWGSRVNFDKPARQCLEQYMQSKWLWLNEYQKAGVNLHLGNILTFLYLLRN